MKVLNDRCLKSVTGGTRCAETQSVCMPRPRCEMPKIKIFIKIVVLVMVKLNLGCKRSCAPAHQNPCNGGSDPQ